MAWRFPLRTSRARISEWLSGGHAADHDAAFSAITIARDLQTRQASIIGAVGRAIERNLIEAAVLVDVGLGPTSLRTTSVATACRRLEGSFGGRITPPRSRTIT